MSMLSGSPLGAGRAGVRRVGTGAPAGEVLRIERGGSLTVTVGSGCVPRTGRDEEVAGAEVASGEVVWNAVGGAPSGGREPGWDVLVWASAAAPAPKVSATASALPNFIIQNPSRAGLYRRAPAKTRKTVRCSIA
jgi:hypothetical protein